MHDMSPSQPIPPSRSQALAARLLQLADDSDRVGLRREAAMLTALASSVLDGRDLIHP